VEAHSRPYETEPVGLSDQGKEFINAAIALRTDLSPENLMKEMRRTELALGKSRLHESHLSRAIDLDLLLYGDAQILDNGMQVPHPRMHNRAFVLVPLAEIAPGARHPVLECTIGDLLKALPEEELERVRLLRPVSRPDG